jgi:hypothetical protein
VNTRTGHLQLKEDLEFQRREWRFQRVSWWGLSTFVVVAMLGVFGGGPLSTASATSADGVLRVKYERFVRVGARTRLVIDSQRSAERATNLELRIARPYYEAMRLEVTPAAADLSIGPSTVTLRFAVSAQEPLTVFLDADPAWSGSHATTISAGGGTSVDIRQFAYF